MTGDGDGDGDDGNDYGVVDDSELGGFTRDGFVMMLRAAVMIIRSMAM